MQKIGFIGMGNMGGAIARGLLDGGAVAPENLFAFDVDYPKLKAVADEKGFHACPSVEEMLDQVDTVLMAVKPIVVEGVLARQFDRLKGKALLSIVAGYQFEKYQTLVDPSVRVQYIMPNVPCSVGEGVFLFEQENSLTPEERETAMRMFSAAGEVVSLPAYLMNAGMAISGCGPAFIAMVIEALADAGVKYGLPRAAAYKLASQTAVGTGKLQLATNTIPAAIKDAVCSPGGITIRGCEALEKANMRAAFYDAVKATMEK